MRAKLGALDDRTDEEVAAETVGGDPLAIIPAETWYRHVVGTEAGPSHC